MNIDLHIERLVLEGLPISRNQGHLVQAAVEAELSRLLTQEGLTGSLTSGGAVPVVRAETVSFSIESEPAAIGTQIARAVYGGISQ